MLTLIIADRNRVSPVQQHVGGHQHRVVEDPRGHQLLLCAGLVLELRHPLKFAVGGHAHQQPLQLAVLEHVALAEEDATIGIESCGQHQRREVVDAGAQGRGS